MKSIHKTDKTGFSPIRNKNTKAKIYIGLQDCKGVIGVQSAMTFYIRKFMLLFYRNFGHITNACLCIYSWTLSSSGYEYPKDTPQQILNMQTNVLWHYL
jgi:hypothetical protein